MLKRLFPSRWARIVAWTGAAIAWGTSIVAVQAQVQESALHGMAGPAERIVFVIS